MSSLVAVPAVFPLADCPPPHVAHERLASRHPTTFILESRDGPGRTARYSIVGWAPVGRVRLDASGLTAEGSISPVQPGEEALAYLRRVIAQHHVPERSLPFVGGFVGSAGYDLSRTLEPTLERSGGGESWPRLLLGLYLDAIVYDHLLGTAHYVTVGADRRVDLDALRDIPAVPTIRDRAAVPALPPALRVGPLAATCDAERFTQRVQQAKALLNAGECFQIVLSRAYQASFTGDLGECYRTLRDGEPAPYLYHLRFGGRSPLALLGASPETLVRVRAGQAETFPIAGTRPATGNARTDEAAARELLADRKEGAEHAMLVDLARNDLARVCLPGTVKVASLRQVERARTVQHLVSHVVGDLRPECDALDAFAAVFPAGTVSGAPKVRAMEHIARLEDAPRGPYAGAVLYASFNGDLDSAIAIRSLSAVGDRLTVQAGAGIVLASDPAAEFEETRRKAATMLAALRPFGAILPRHEIEATGADTTRAAHARAEATHS